MNSQARSSNVIRVFISSTFKDMHAERDHLVTVAYPQLEERLSSLGMEFYDVDLRWGVPQYDADGEKANSWQYCKRAIDETEPFFLCMLGQRYGWVIDAGGINDEEDRLQCQGLSITEMEIRHAVLDQRQRYDGSFFYLRQTQAPKKPDLRDLSYVRRRPPATAT
jgi:nephrocystin-3